jgi:hypothetical protein
VRTNWWICVLVMLCAATGLAAQRGAEGSAAGEKFIGMWSGTWSSEGSGTGGFELILEKGTDGAIAGRVSVTGEPTYKATFKELTFDGDKMKGRYDFPADENIEVVVGATFEAKSAKGTWAAREKASGNEVAAGTLTIAKQN